MARPAALPTFTPGSPCPHDHGHIVSPDFASVVGTGPVYAGGFLGNDDGMLPYADASRYGSSDWGGQKVLWIIDPSYSGPVLVRGGQLDGTHELRFDRGLDLNGTPDDDLVLQPELRLMGGPGWGKPWPNYPTNTRVQAPGCYAYQVDGLNFSYHIIFQAMPQPGG